jgi:hypothetical protein
LSASAHTSGPMPSPPMTAIRFLFVPVLTDPALSPEWLLEPEIEKPPTQWTVERRARMWRA